MLSWAHGSLELCSPLLCMAPSISCAQASVSSASNMRPRADLNRDCWIQGPECWPLHHEAVQNCSDLWTKPQDLHAGMSCSMPPLLCRTLMAAWKHAGIGAHGTQHGMCGGHCIVCQQDEASRRFEPRSLDSGSRVLAVTPRGHPRKLSWDTENICLSADI